MTPEERQLFDKATPAAKNLFKTAQAMKREQRRAEFKQALLKQSQTIPVPAESGRTKP